MCPLLIFVQAHKSPKLNQQGQEFHCTLLQLRESSQSLNKTKNKGKGSAGISHGIPRYHGVMGRPRKSYDKVGQPSIYQVNCNG